MCFVCICYDTLFMMHGCKILMTTAKALHSNILAGENKSLFDVGDEENTVSGIPCFLFKDTWLGNFDFCLGIKATK